MRVADKHKMSVICMTYCLTLPVPPARVLAQWSTRALTSLCLPFSVMICSDCFFVAIHSKWGGGLEQEGEQTEKCIWRREVEEGGSWQMILLKEATKESYRRSMKQLFSWWSFMHASVRMQGKSGRAKRWALCIARGPQYRLGIEWCAVFSASEAACPCCELGDKWLQSSWACWGVILCSADSPWQVSNIRQKYHMSREQWPQAWSYGKTDVFFVLSFVVEPLAPQRLCKLDLEVGWSSAAWLFGYCHVSSTTGFLGHCWIPNTP